MSISTLPNDVITNIPTNTHSISCEILNMDPKNSISFSQIHLVIQKDFSFLIKLTINLQLNEINNLSKLWESHKIYIEVKNNQLYVQFTNNLLDVLSPYSRVFRELDVFFFQIFNNIIIKDEEEKKIIHTFFFYKLLLLSSSALADNLKKGREYMYNFFERLYDEIKWFQKPPYQEAFKNSFMQNINCYLDRHFPIFEPKPDPQPSNSFKEDIQKIFKNDLIPMNQNKNDENTMNQNKNDENSLKSKVHTVRNEAFQKQNFLYGRGNEANPSVWKKESDGLRTLSSLCSQINQISNK